MERAVFKTHRNVTIINSDRFMNSYKEYLAGKTHFAELSGRDFYISAFETKPMPGFEFPKSFPNCCKSHKRIAKQALDRFNQFPFCCDLHKGLASTPWFDKTDYTYVPQKVLNTIVYTLACIAECINHENWYKEITDYIQYTIDSYGQFPFGYGGAAGINEYIGCIENNIPSIEGVSVKKKEQLIAFIDALGDKGWDNKQPDLNQLIDIYKQWLRIFPFELSYLSHLEPHFRKQIPILCGPFETNIYTGITSSKIIEKKELINFLTESTLAIIKAVNAVEAFKKNQLQDKVATRIEILNAKHKLQLETLSFKGKESENAYLKILKKWLKQEKEYVEELTDIIRDDYSTTTFILNLVEGMKLLQSGDTNEDCLVTIRNKGKGKETKFRHWFRTFLAARYKGSVVTAEEENGPGRMDLKIYHQHLGTKVIEFKGWWNRDKGGTTTQLINYLTDFEGDGFIFMINNLEQKDIVADYKDLVEQEGTAYEPASWLAHQVPNSDFAYYESKHKSAIKMKTIYHFVFNVNF
jgi:hypothetical protein